MPIPEKPYQPFGSEKGPMNERSAQVAQEAKQAFEAAGAATQEMLLREVAGALKPFKVYNYFDTAVIYASQVMDRQFKGSGTLEKIGALLHFVEEKGVPAPELGATYSAGSEFDKERPPTGSVLITNAGAQALTSLLEKENARARSERGPS